MEGTLLLLKFFTGSGKNESPFLLWSALAAVVPTLFYILLLLWSGKFKRTTLKYILYCFLYGAFGAGIIVYLIYLGLFYGASLSGNSEIYKSLQGSVVFAPIIEEIVKALFLFTGFIKKNMNSLADGIVFGGAIGLGFGMTENFLYFLSFGINIESLVILIIVRTIFSAVMHCLSAAVCGAFISSYRSGKTFVKYIFITAGLIIAIIIHTTWNLSVSANTVNSYGFFFIPGILFIFIFLYIFSLHNKRKIITSKLNEELKTNKFE